MPAYNCATTIEEAVRSIMETNFHPHDELIIVDDGSIDKTSQKITKLCQKYKSIRVLRNHKNLGCPASRNIGITAANNTLIFNIDADDVLEKNSVIKLKNYLIIEKADIAAFSEIHYFKDPVRIVTHKWINPPGKYELSDFLADIITPGGNCLYTKDSWNRVGKYWEYGKGLHEYWGYYLKHLAKGSKMVVLDNSYYYHRYGKKSLFARENTSLEVSNLMATKMIKPFLEILNIDDKKYIMSKKGRISWLTNLNTKPIRLKNKVKPGRFGKIIINRQNAITRIYSYLYHLLDI